MNVLLHVCCAPCAVKCVEALRSEGIEPHGFWYNPNIHPFTEYQNRKKALDAYAAAAGMKLAQGGGYGLRPFIESVWPAREDRCAACYRIRLDAAAQYAAQNGFDTFTTTLLISPYQNHELIRRVGEQAAKRYGVSFLPRDFRPLFREGQHTARAMGLYMQKYCGCVFSEEERYANKKSGGA